MSVELRKMVIKSLRCPSCYNTMCPPINQCCRGHSICHSCYRKVSHCPVCRGLKNNAARNYALEDLYEKLVVPCKFKYLGCTKNIMEEDDDAVEKHQKICKYTKTRCPFEVYDICDWNDSKIRLKAHLLEKHTNNFYQKDKQKFISQKFANIISYHYIFAVIYVYDNYFRLTWEINEKTGMTRWALYLLGSPEEAKKFYYKLEFTNSQCNQLDTIPLTFKAVCEPQPQKRHELFIGHNCFYVHKSRLDQFCTTTKNLHYKITIYSFEEDSTYNIANLFESM